MIKRMVDNGCCLVVRFVAETGLSGNLSGLRFALDIVLVAVAVAVAE